MALNRSQGSIRRRTRSVLRAGRRRAERAWAGAETRRRRAVGGGATDEGWRPWLTPLLVDVFGRDGSTLTMRLLATSPAIAVEPPHGADLDRFERPYFAWLWGWS